MTANKKEKALFVARVSRVQGILNSENIDLESLQTVARGPGGLLTDTIRADAWLKYMKKKKNIISISNLLPLFHPCFYFLFILLNFCFCVVVALMHLMKNLK